MNRVYGHFFEMTRNMSGISGYFLEKVELVRLFVLALCMKNRESQPVSQKRVNVANTQSVTASLFAQSVFIWVVSRYGLRDVFRMSVLWRWSSIGLQ